jgi:hypothetical protein
LGIDLQKCFQTNLFRRKDFDVKEIMHQLLFLKELRSQENINDENQFKPDEAKLMATGFL